MERGREKERERGREGRRQRRLHVHPGEKDMTENSCSDIIAAGVCVCVVEGT